jgi:hypothetical protein
LAGGIFPLKKSVGVLLSFRTERLECPSAARSPIFTY